MEEIRVSLPKELKDKLESVKEHGYSTISEFVRESIRDKLRRIEHPELYAGSNDPKLLEKIYKITQQQKELLEENLLHKTEINGNMKYLSDRINGSYKQLYSEKIITLLKEFGNLRIEQISSKLDIDENEVLKALAFLQQKDQVKLNHKNGGFEYHE